MYRVMALLVVSPLSSNAISPVTPVVLVAATAAMMASRPAGVVTLSAPVVLGGRDDGLDDHVGGVVGVRVVGSDLLARVLLP